MADNNSAKPPSKSSAFGTLALGLACLGFGIYEYIDLGAMEAQGGARTKSSYVAFLYNILGRNGVLVFFLILGAAMLFFGVREFLKPKK